ncbi:MAG: GIY-YIG nuclease family protein [Paludibacter sp.]|jgi:putative endonuclease|nr:GIY-YIG nuclease family protein [Paludibacter sp.]
MEKGGYVYIMANCKNGTLYSGVTADLIRRIQEHKNKSNPQSFTAKYNCHNLVYYCFFQRIEYAIEEEKRIKGGSRKAKLKLIEDFNSKWEDLYFKIC